jgi:hypothetical protein
LEVVCVDKTERGRKWVGKEARKLERAGRFQNDSEMFIEKAEKVAKVLLPGRIEVDKIKAAEGKIKIGSG